MASTRHLPLPSRCLSWNFVELTASCFAAAPNARWIAVVSARSPELRGGGWAFDVLHLIGELIYRSFEAHFGHGLARALSRLRRCGERERQSALMPKPMILGIYLGAPRLPPARIPRASGASRRRPSRIRRDPCPRDGSPLQDYRLRCDSALGLCESAHAVGQRGHLGPAGQHGVRVAELNSLSAIPMACVEVVHTQSQRWRVRPGQVEGDRLC